MEDFLNPYVKKVEGVNVPVFFAKEYFESVLRFRPKPGDIFIATYPKCGTTWMQNLVLNILRRGEPLAKPRDFHLASPFLDLIGSEDSEKMMIRPGAYKTHLPFSKVPWSVDAKYIYVARNPKDCCISFYHHMKQIPMYQFFGTLDEFLNYFVKGELEFNDYFDHLLGWYEMRNAPNVYFTTFERMKKDLETVALEVAEFIKPDERRYLKENPTVLQKILHNCSFGEMKIFINEALSSLYKADKNDPEIPRARKYILEHFVTLPKNSDEEIEFMRKGKTGNWKTELTEDHDKILNQYISEKPKGTDVMTLWENIN